MDPPVYPEDREREVSKENPVPLANPENPDSKDDEDLKEILPWLCQEKPGLALQERRETEATLACLELLDSLV